MDDATAQKFKDYIAALRETEPKHVSGTCPNCGYCPHCGRGRQMQPIHYYGPYYVPSYPTQPWISPWVTYTVTNTAAAQPKIDYGFYKQQA